MFSDLHKVCEKLPIASDQRTYATDTRDEIRRKSPVHERKQHKDHQKTPEQGLFGDDQTEISVSSLEAFLPLLLKTYAPHETSHERRTAISDAEHPHKHKNTTSPAAKAAGAYARTSDYSPVPQLKDKIAQSRIEDSSPPEQEHPSLSKSEVSAIYRLQEEVASLKAKGVQSIYINKADTFLKSLQNGVQDALLNSR